MHEERGILVGLAAAAVCDAVMAATSAAAASGVCLPEGFAERLGGAAARRAIRALRRLAASSFRAGVMHGRALERLAAQAGQQEPES